LKLDYKLETINCPLCGKNNYEPYLTNVKELYNGTDNYFTVVKCCDCGMVFTNPRPTKDSIGVFYPDSAGYYQPKKRNKENTIEEKIKRTILAHYYSYKIKAPFGEFLAFLFKKLIGRKLAVSHISNYVEGGKLLDIGCSWGQYLSEMAYYGWDVYGIEINKKAVDHAKNVLGMKNIDNCSFEEYQCQDNFFDVIHMSMAVEHLHDPLGCLKRAHNLLKKNGKLIISVPDISGFEARIYGKIAYTLQAPQHLNHFTPGTITAMLNKSGFNVERIIHQSSGKDLIESAKYLDNKLLHNILKSPPIKKLFIKPFAFLLAKCGKTSRMSVYATKN